MPDSTMTPASAEATVAAAAQAMDAQDTAAEAADKSKSAAVVPASTEGGDATAEELAAAELAALESEQHPAEKTDEEKTAEQDAAQAKAQKAAERHALKMDGKDVELTLDELKELASKGGDYTKKTQQAAEIRKAAEAELQEHRAARQQYGEGLAKVKSALEAMLPPEPDWTKVRAERPDTYPQEFADFQVQQKHLAALTAEQERVVQEETSDRLRQRAEFTAAERERFVAAVPEFVDPVKGPELREKIYTAAGRYGFTREQVDDTSSASLLLMLNDARKYHEIVAARKVLDAKMKAAATAAAAVEPAGGKLPTASPGGGRKAPTPDQKAAEVAIAQLRRTGSVSDAAAALDALDL